MNNLTMRANGVKLLIKDSFERSQALREAAFVKKIGTVKPGIKNSGILREAHTDYLSLKLLNS